MLAHSLADFRRRHADDLASLDSEMARHKSGSIERRAGRPRRPKPAAPLEEKPKEPDPMIVILQRIETGLAALSQVMAAPRVAVVSRDKDGRMEGAMIAADVTA